MHLRDEHIDELLKMIDIWDPDVFGGLTWGRVLERFKKQHGRAPTERSLRNQARIKARFNQKKEELRTGNAPISKKPASLTRAAEKIQRLEAELRAVKAENDRILHRLILWQKNASDFGMTKKDLERPMHIKKETLRNNQEQKD
jgi:chromosome segregation ATPase